MGEKEHQAFQLGLKNIANSAPSLLEIYVAIEKNLKSDILHQSVYQGVMGVFTIGDVLRTHLTGVANEYRNIMEIVRHKSMKLESSSKGGNANADSTPEERAKELLSDFSELEKQKKVTELLEQTRRGLFSPLATIPVTVSGLVDYALGVEGGLQRWRNLAKAVWNDVNPIILPFQNTLNSMYSQSTGTQRENLKKMSNAASYLDRVVVLGDATVKLEAMLNKHWEEISLVSAKISTLLEEY